MTDADITAIRDALVTRDPLLIATECHPERIARLLDALDQARAEAARLERYATHCESMISAMKESP